MSEYRVVPVTGRAALRWIAENHRHLPKLQGALFAVGVARGVELVGVATAGNPAQVWQNTGRVAITRCAAKSNLPGIGEHAAPVCSMLYSAICRAAAALGYQEAWTYTLPGEDGRSILAAGFIAQGVTDGGEHSRESRPRAPAVNAAPKGRWMKPLTREARLAAASAWLAENPDVKIVPAPIARIVAHLRRERRLAA